MTALALPLPDCPCVLTVCLCVLQLSFIAYVDYSVCCFVAHLGYLLSVYFLLLLSSVLCPCCCMANCPSPEWRLAGDIQSAFTKWMNNIPWQIVLASLQFWKVHPLNTIVYFQKHWHILAKFFGLPLAPIFIQVWSLQFPFSSPNTCTLL